MTRVSDRHPPFLPQTTGDAYTVGPLQSGPPCCVPEPWIRVTDLSVSYGGHRALEQVTVEIYRGCITALIGPSGCGKTSFLSALNRLTDLIPGCRVEGGIRIGGQDVLGPRLDVPALRREVGMIFQKPNPFPLSIRRNIEMPLRELGRKKRADLEETLERVLTDVGHGTRSRIASTNPPWRSLAASSSACASPGRWPWNPPCSSWTSPAAPSIRFLPASSRT